MKIYLIRHGESEGNVRQKNNEHYPELDQNISLTQEGRIQSIEAGYYLMRDLGKVNDSEVHIYVSPYKRAMETYELATQGLKAKTVNVEALIREQEWKNFKDKLDIEDTLEKRDRYGKFYYRFKNGESVADTYTRAVTFVNKLKLDYMMGRIKGNIMVFSHQVHITMLLCALLDSDASQYDSFPRYENCQILKLDFSKERVILETDNLRKSLEK
jgi:broad specificity phosphatase PhoE